MDDSCGRGAAGGGGPPAQPAPPLVLCVGIDTEGPSSIPAHTTAVRHALRVLRRCGFHERAVDAADVDAMFTRRRREGAEEEEGEDKKKPGDTRQGHTTTTTTSTDTFVSAASAPPPDVTATRLAETEGTGGNGRHNIDGSGALPPVVLVLVSGGADALGDDGAVHSHPGATATVDDVREWSAGAAGTRVAVLDFGSRSRGMLFVDGVALATASPSWGTAGFLIAFVRAVQDSWGVDGRVSLHGIARRLRAAVQPAPTAVEVSFAPPGALFLSKAPWCEHPDRHRRASACGGADAIDAFFSSDSDDASDEAAVDSDGTACPGSDNDGQGGVPERRRTRKRNRDAHDAPATTAGATPRPQSRPVYTYGDPQAPAGGARGAAAATRRGGGGAAKPAVEGGLRARVPVAITTYLPVASTAEVKEQAGGADGMLAGTYAEASRAGGAAATPHADRLWGEIHGITGALAAAMGALRGGGVPTATAVHPLAAGQSQRQNQPGHGRHLSPPLIKDRSGGAADSDGSERSYGSARRDAQHNRNLVALYQKKQLHAALSAGGKGKRRRASPSVKSKSPLVGSLGRRGEHTWANAAHEHDGASSVASVPRSTSSSRRGTKATAPLDAVVLTGLVRSKSYHFSLRSRAWLTRVAVAMEQQGLEVVASATRAGAVLSASDTRGSGAAAAPGGTGASSATSKWGALLTSTTATGGAAAGGGGGGDMVSGPGGMCAAAHAVLGRTGPGGARTGTQPPPVIYECRVRKRRERAKDERSKKASRSRSRRGPGGRGTEAGRDWFAGAIEGPPTSQGGGGGAPHAQRRSGSGKRFRSLRKAVANVEALTSDMKAQAATRKKLQPMSDGRTEWTPPRPLSLTAGIDAVAQRVTSELNEVIARNQWGVPQASQRERFASFESGLSLSIEEVRRARQVEQQQQQQQQLAGLSHATTTPSSISLTTPVRAGPRRGSGGSTDTGDAAPAGDPAPLTNDDLCLLWFAKDSDKRAALRPPPFAAPVGVRAYERITLLAHIANDGGGALDALCEAAALHDPATPIAVEVGYPAALREEPCAVHGVRRPIAELVVAPGGILACGSAWPCRPPPQAAALDDRALALNRRGGRDHELLPPRPQSAMSSASSAAAKPTAGGGGPCRDPHPLRRPPHSRKVLEDVWDTRTGVTIDPPPLVYGRDTAQTIPVYSVVNDKHARHYRPASAPLYRTPVQDADDAGEARQQRAVGSARPRTAATKRPGTAVPGRRGSDARGGGGSSRGATTAERRRPSGAAGDADEGSSDDGVDWGLAGAEAKSVGSQSSGSSSRDSAPPPRSASPSHSASLSSRSCGSTSPRRTADRGRRAPSLAGSSASSRSRSRSSSRSSSASSTPTREATAPVAQNAGGDADETVDEADAGTNANTPAAPALRSSVASSAIGPAQPQRVSGGGGNGADVAVTATAATEPQAAPVAIGDVSPMRRGSGAGVEMREGDAVEQSNNDDNDVGAKDNDGGAGGARATETARHSSAGGVGSRRGTGPQGHPMAAAAAAAPPSHRDSARGSLGSAAPSAREAPRYIPPEGVRVPDLLITSKQQVLDLKRAYAKLVNRVREIMLTCGACGAGVWAKEGVVEVGGVGTYGLYEFVYAVRAARDTTATYCHQAGLQTAAPQAILGEQTLARVVRRILTAATGSAEGPWSVTYPLFLILATFDASDPTREVRGVAAFLKHFAEWGRGTGGGERGVDAENDTNAHANPVGRRGDAEANDADGHGSGLVAAANGVVTTLRGLRDAVVTLQEATPAPPMAPAPLAVRKLSQRYDRGKSGARRTCTLLFDTLVSPTDGTAGWFAPVPAAMMCIAVQLPNPQLWVFQTLERASRLLGVAQARAHHNCYVDTATDDDDDEEGEMGEVDDGVVGVDTPDVDSITGDPVAAGDTHPRRGTHRGSAFMLAGVVPESPPSRRGTSSNKSTPALRPAAAPPSPHEAAARVLP